MKKLINAYKWMSLVAAIILTLIGVVIFALTIVDCVKASDIGGYPTYAGAGVAYTFAIGLFIIGLIYVIVSLVKEPKTFCTSTTIAAISAIIVGALFIILRDYLGAVMVKVFAWGLIIAGALFLAKSIMFIVQRQKALFIVGALVTTAVALAIGILALTPATSKVMSLIIFFVVATFMLVGGIIDIVMSIKMLTKKEEL